MVDRQRRLKHKRPARARSPQVARLTIEVLERRDVLSPVITTPSPLPAWTVNQPAYLQTIQSTGAVDAVTFNEMGNLPPGLTMVGPSFTTIDDPTAEMDPAGDSFAYGISGNNIVGSYQVGLTFHGFLYDGTTFQTLDDPAAGSSGTQAEAVSGSTVVGFYTGVDQSDHSFLYDGSNYAPLDDPQATGGTLAYGVSGSNVVGVFHNGTGSHGFLYNGSTYTTLDDPQAMLGTFAAGVSGNTVVGYYLDTNMVSHGFIYDGTSFQTIDDPGAGNTPMQGTVIDGVSGTHVVGSFIDSSGQSHGFFYDGSTFTTIDEPAAVGTANVPPATNAYGISGNTIVGSYQVGSDFHGFSYNMVQPTLSGTPTKAGTYNFSVTESDGMGTSQPANYTLVINPAVAITTTSLPAWTAGQAGYNQTITATGGTNASGTTTGPYAWSTSAGTLPTGLTLNTSTGALSGTPTTPGTYMFTIAAMDTVGAAASQSYTVVINPVVAITPTTLPDGSTGTAYSQTLTASGGTGSSTFAASAGTLPTGLTLSSTGVLSGTPTASGSFTFTVTATDTVGASANASYTVNISSSMPTQLTLTAPSTATAGTSFNVTVTAEDAGGHTATGFGGTVTLSSTAGADIAPTSVVLSGGTATLAVTLTAAGPQTLTASFTGLTSGTALITVSPGSLHQYLVGIPGSSTVQAGTGFLVTVQAADAYSNPITNYSGPASVTATVSPTSAASNFPTSVAISSTGLGLFLGNLQKVGSYTISVASGSLTGSASPVTVTAAPAAKLAFATQPVSTPTGLTLPAVTVQVQDLFGNVVTKDNSDNITLSVASGPGFFAPGSTTSAVATSGVATFNNLTLVKPGTYSLAATVPGLYTGPSSAAFTVIPLQVVASSFVGSPTGFSLQFNTPFLINSTTPVLYGQGFKATAPVPSVTVTQTADGSGNPVSVPVTGSLIVSAATNSITFLATDTTLAVNNSGSPILPGGTYTVDLTSGPAVTGFQALGSGGGFLDGKGTGKPGSGDFIATFTVSAAAQNNDVLWVPPTADGPGQTLNGPGLNQLDTGFPIYLNDSTGTVTSVQVTLNYDPNLLTVTGATGNSKLSGSTFTLNTALSTPGHAVLQYSDSGANSGKLTGGQVPLGYLNATVPSGSTANPVAYRAKDLLHLSAGSINSGAVPLTTSDGLHLVAYVGDADGNGAYSSNDAVLITRVGLQSDLGFAAYPLIDPVIVADTDGAGFIPADAALQANEAGVGFGTANLAVPPIPQGVHFTPVANNVDPTLSLVTGHLSFANDQGPMTKDEEAAVNIDDAHPAGSTGLVEAHLALTYDPSVFTVSAADIHLGSVLAVATGWSLTPTIDPATGQIAIALSSSTPITSTQGGSLVTIDFHVNDGEPGGVSPRSSSPSPIALVASADPNGQYVTTELEDTQGTFTLTPAPTNTFDPRLDTVITPAAPVVSLASDVVTPLRSVESSQATDTSALAERIAAVPPEIIDEPPTVPPTSGDQSSPPLLPERAIVANAALEASGQFSPVIVAAALPAVSSLGIPAPLAAWPVLPVSNLGGHAGQALSDSSLSVRGPVTPIDQAVVSTMRDALDRVMTISWPRMSPPVDSVDVLDGDTLSGDSFNVDPSTSASSMKPGVSSLRPGLPTRPLGPTEGLPSIDHAAMDRCFAQITSDATLADDEWLMDAASDDA